MIVCSKKDCYFTSCYCYIFYISIDWAYPVKEQFKMLSCLFLFSSRFKEVKCWKWCPESNQIKACGQCQDKIHREHRALDLDSGYLSSRNAILIFLPGSVWSPERVTSWVSPLSLDPNVSRSLTSAQGIGCSRCLSVWPRNRFSRKFPNKTWKDRSWNTMQIMACTQATLVCTSQSPALQVSDAPFPVPRGDTIHWQGHLCSIWTWPSYTRLSSASYPFYCHFTLPRLLFLMPGGLGNLVLKMGSLLHPRVPLEQFARLRNILLCLFHRPILELHLE